MEKMVLFFLVVLLVLIPIGKAEIVTDTCIPEAEILDVSFIEPSCDLSPGHWCGGHNLYCLEVKARYIGEGIVNPLLKTPSNPKGFSLSEAKKLEGIGGKCPGGVYLFSKCAEPTENTTWELLIEVNTKTSINNRTYGREYNLTYGPYTLEPMEQPWPTTVKLTPQQQMQYSNWCKQRNENCGVVTKEIDCNVLQANLRICEMYLKDISGGGTDCEQLRYPLREFCLKNGTVSPPEKITTTTVAPTKTTTLHVIFPEYDPNKNYCGPEGKFSVPQNSLVSDASFNKACYDHDKCYELCGITGHNQDYCDLEFKNTMDDSCSQAFDDHMNECDKKSGWSPLKYTCMASARLRASSCWAQSKTYQSSVSLAGKLIGAYPC